MFVDQSHAARLFVNRSMSQYLSHLRVSTKATWSVMNCRTRRGRMNHSPAAATCPGRRSDGNRLPATGHRPAFFTAIHE